MGKIKKKLRYLLIDKNSDVRTEYEELSNPSLLKLLRLNWHYRILNKKYTLYQKKERKNSHLSISDKTPLTDALSKLTYYDIISFDIFDTLILRPFPSPTDLFSILEKKTGIKNFKNIRIKAEENARKKSLKQNNHTEISIYDIYARFPKKANIDVEKSIEEELFAEEENCFSNPYIYEIYNSLISMNKQIIIASDMYIPCNRMKNLLKKCGYAGYQKLYVSCDFCAGKHQGELYEIIKKDYPDAKIIHLGDNYHSDVLSARKHGVDSIYYNN